MPLLAGSASLGTGLAGVIKTALTPTVGADTTPNGLSDALATAIITYILANATLTPALIAPPGTAGGPCAGTVTLT